MMNILVTGGAGYIGSHACKALAAGGYVPVTFDNFSTGWRDAVKFGPLVEGDLCNRDDIARVFDSHKIAAVMHFGALSDVGQSVREPELYWRNNADGSANLLAAMADAGVDKIVFSSTCATYGDQDGVTLNEDSAQEPINAYGGSKLKVEKAILEQAGLSSVIFRYFNVAGADPETEIGEFHRPETHLIPLILDAHMGRRDALTVFGTDYDTADGTPIRDYVHVSDLIDAHILGLQWLLDDNDSQIFNLGTGHGFSVMQVMQEAAKIVGAEIPKIIGDRRAGDCTKLVSGSEKATQMLGWAPKRSTLPQMISDAWRWHQVGNYKE